MLPHPAAGVEYTDGGADDPRGRLRVPRRVRRTSPPRHLLDKPNGHPSLRKRQVAADKEEAPMKLVHLAKRIGHLVKGTALTIVLAVAP